MDKDNSKGLEMLVRAIMQVRDKLDSVSIDNLDEVKASLHNELGKAIKPLAKALQAGDKATADLIGENMDFVVLKRKATDVNIKNVSDFKISKDSRITNLEDIKKYFDSLASSIEASIKGMPKPNVSVIPPDIHIPEIKVPDIKVDIPETKVTVEGADMSGLLEAIKNLKDTIRRTSANTLTKMQAFSGPNSVEVRKGKIRIINTTAEAVPVTITGGSSSGTEYTDGDEVATPDGGAILGHDGSNVRAVKTDADGHVQVDVLSGGGGGTQYTEAATDATITGTAIMWEDTSDTLRAVSAAKPLPIDGSGVTQPVSASSLPLPSGAATAANQATGNSSLSTIASDTTSLDGKVTACNTGAVTISAALPAGTNAIGKLAANDGVDIGNVDVASISNGSINGPSEPTIDSYTSAAISASANTANQSLISAPGANKQIWVYGVTITADTGDGSVSFQDEDDTAVSGVMEVVRRGGFSISPSGNFSMPVWKVATNKALEIDTVTCGAKGTISYAVVSV